MDSAHVATWHLALVGASGVVALALGFGLPRFVEVNAYFTHGAYWCVAVGMLFLGVFLRRETDYGGREWVLAVAPLAAVALVLTALLFVAVGVEFRVLNDETNLLGTAQSFFVNRRALIVTQGFHYYDAFQVIETELPSRPLLFPFLISVLHVLVGYSPYHGFVVNFLAAAVTLTVVGLLGTRYGGQATGLVAMILLAGFPLFALCATSSGFETLNLALLSLLLWQLSRCIAAPSTGAFERLAVLLFLGAECRYETILFVLPMLVAAWLHRRVFFERPVALWVGVLPLLFVPHIWQRMLTTVVNAPDGDTVAEPFAMHNVPGNLVNAARFFFGIGEMVYPTSEVTVGLAVLGVIVFLAAGGRDKTRRRVGMVALPFLGFLLILLAQTGFYLGDIRLPVQSRLGLVYVLPLVLAAAYALQWLCAQVRCSRALPVAALAIAYFGLNIAQHNEAGRSLDLYREYKNNLAFFKTQPKAGTLIIAIRPGLYAVHEYGAVHFDYVKKYKAQMLRHLDRHRHERVFVIQIVYDFIGRPRPLLDEAFTLTPVLEYQNSKHVSIRISQVEHRVR